MTFLIMTKQKKSSVLLIYTGGTIGMMQDVVTGELKPFDFKSLTKQIPELNKFDIDLSSISFKEPIDSSNMHPSVWIELVKIIKDNYKHISIIIQLNKIITRQLSKINIKQQIHQTFLAPSYYKFFLLSQKIFQLEERSGYYE
jgi:hypothetical protein